MQAKEADQLHSGYVKAYYDAQVAPLTSYEQGRWHSSPVREFEYRQTKRALKKALEGKTYARGLEIGPGDGVWTSLIKDHVTGPLHLIEQSEEMLRLAKERHQGTEGLTFERSDFMAAKAQENNDLIIAVRCFEYFSDKEGALKKMRTLLAPGGRLIIVTKNAELLTHSSVQQRRIHSGQISRRTMRELALKAGFTVERVYPAVVRWKASFVPLRVAFDLLQKLGVITHGRVVLPFATYATESYVYVIRAQ